VLAAALYRQFYISNSSYTSWIISLITFLRDFSSGLVYKKYSQRTFLYITINGCLVWRYEDL